MRMLASALVLVLILIAIQTAPVGADDPPLPATRVVLTQRVELLPRDPLCWNAAEAQVPVGVRTPSTDFTAHALTVVFSLDGQVQIEYADGPTVPLATGQAGFIGANNWHAERNTGNSPARLMLFALSCQTLPSGIPGLRQVGNSGTLRGGRPVAYNLQLIERTWPAGAQGALFQLDAESSTGVYVIEGA